MAHISKLTSITNKMQLSASIKYFVVAFSQCLKWLLCTHKTKQAVQSMYEQITSHILISSPDRNQRLAPDNSTDVQDKIMKIFHAHLCAKNIFSPTLPLCRQVIFVFVN